MHPRVQIFTDTSKKGINIGYALQGGGGDITPPLRRVPGSLTGKVSGLSMADGRNKSPYRTIIDFFKHEKVRGLMKDNSDWLEVLDPDDPPMQSEDGEGGAPPPHP